MAQSRGGGFLLLCLTVLTVSSVLTRPENKRTSNVATEVPAMSTMVNATPEPAHSNSAELGAVQYVKSVELNVRFAPKGKVVGTLKQGEAVQVYETKGKWARISAYGDAPRWVSAPNLCDEIGCSKPKLDMSVLSSNFAANPPSGQRPSSSEGCPCSGSIDCVGPRGGHYCFTSGGNKRYR